MAYFNSSSCNLRRTDSEFEPGGFVVVRDVTVLSLSWSRGEKVANRVKTKCRHCQTKTHTHLLHLYAYNVTLMFNHCLITGNCTFSQVFVFYKKKYHNKYYMLHFYLRKQRTIEQFKICKVKLLSRCPVSRSKIRCYPKY